MKITMLDIFIIHVSVHDMLTRPHMYHPLYMCNDRGQRRDGGFGRIVDLCLSLGVNIGWVVLLLSDYAVVKQWSRCVVSCPGPSGRDGQKQDWLDEISVRPALNIRLSLLSYV